jgi:hypothetical protein
MKREPTLAELIKQHGPNFKVVTETERRFDATAKPKKPRRKPVQQTEK